MTTTMTTTDLIAIRELLQLLGVPADDLSDDELATHSRLLPAVARAGAESGPMGRLARLARLANGRRRTRLLSVASVVYVIREAREDGWAFGHGGTFANAYPYSAITTVTLAVTVGPCVLVGVSTANGKYATPGSAWHSLRGWGRRGPSGDWRSRLPAWVASGDVILLTEDELDAMWEKING